MDVVGNLASVLRGYERKKGQLMLRKFARMPPVALLLMISPMFQGLLLLVMQILKQLLVSRNFLILGLEKLLCPL